MALDMIKLLLCINEKVFHGGNFNGLRTCLYGQCLYQPLLSG